MPEITRPSTSIVTRLLCQMPSSLNDALRTMVEAAEIIEQYRADAVYDETIILKLKARIEALEGRNELLEAALKPGDFTLCDRIEALEAALWTIRLQNVEPYCREIARAALDKDAGQ